MGLVFEVEDAPDLTLPEDKIFRAQLVDLKEHTFTWTDYKDKDRPGQPVQKEGRTLQWWWEIKTSDEYGGRKVKGECEPKISNHPRNKFRPWAEALLNRELPPGTRIDVDDLVGLSADITIRHRPDKKDPARKWEEVDEVMPISGGFSDEPPF